MISASVVIVLLLIFLCYTSSLAMSAKASVTLFHGDEKGVKKIAVIGGGNWGTTISRHLARVSPQVPVHLYCRAESVPSRDNRELCAVVNEEHENCVYLPGVSLPSSVVASDDLASVIRNADIIFFVVPHQFLRGTLQDIRACASLNKDAVCVSLVKGLRIVNDAQDLNRSGITFRPELLSSLIRDELQLVHPVAVMMGANVARDISHDQFAETTIACVDPRVAREIKRVVHAPLFQASTCSNVAAVEICGALKNVVALGAGFCDGLDMGSSTKAAVLRQGLVEIGQFCRLFDADKDRKGQKGQEMKGGATSKSGDESGTSRKRGNEEGQDQDQDSLGLDSPLLTSAGVADLIATCYGGRNRKCAEEFARRLSDMKSTLHSEVANGDIDEEEAEALAGLIDVGALWDTIEEELLGGQKLQGVGTCREISALLHAQTAVAASGGAGAMDPQNKAQQFAFPLFRRIQAIALEGANVESLFDWE